MVMVTKRHKVGFNVSEQRWFLYTDINVLLINVNIIHLSQRASPLTVFTWMLPSLSF